MGLVTVTMLLKGKRGRRRNVEMLVDSGAVWSVLPKRDWEALGLKAERSHRFSLADGTVIERDVSECRFRYEGEEASSPVILGEEGDVALLGGVTLESLALVLNPFDRSLKPMRMLLATLSVATASPLLKRRARRAPRVVRRAWGGAFRLRRVSSHPSRQSPRMLNLQRSCRPCARNAQFSGS